MDSKLERERPIKKSKSRETVVELGQNQEITSCEVSISLNNTSENFEGGKIRFSLDIWETLTSDRTILGYVKGVSVPFEIDGVVKSKSEIRFSEGENILVKNEITNLLKKRIISKVKGDFGDSIVSNVFLRPKSDGTFRMILNLKNFN